MYRTPYPSISSPKANPSQSYQSLKQLPQVGPNTVPPSLRKDVWKPLYTALFPPSSIGRAQGLQAFQKLREYRKLHEVSWTPPAELSRKYGEEEIEELQEVLDQRGGSKKESVWDLMKREKKKVRQRMVMRQKENSVADLAAVLLQQEEEGTRAAEEREKEMAKCRDEEVRAMLRFSQEAKEGGLEKLQGRIEELEGILFEGKEATEEWQSWTRSKMKLELYEMRRQQRRMKFATFAVAEVQPNRMRQVEAEQQRLKEQPNQDVPGQPTEVPELDELKLDTLDKARQAAIERAFTDDVAVAAARASVQNLRMKLPQSIEYTNWLIKCQGWGGLHPEKGMLGTLYHRKARNETLPTALDAVEADLERGGLQAVHRQLDRWEEEVGEKGKRKVRRKLRVLGREEDRVKYEVYEGVIEAVKQNAAQEGNQAKVEWIQRNPMLGSVLAKRGDQLAAKAMELVSERAQDASESLPQQELQQEQDNTAISSSSQDPAMAEGEQAREQEQGQQIAAAAEEKEQEEELTLDYYITHLPSFPPDINPTSLETLARLPKSEGRQRAKILRLHNPIFTVRGVKVQWNDVLDAEFAELWPKDVEHESMGLNRHTAPAPQQEAIQEVADWKAERGWGSGCTKGEGSRKEKDLLVRGGVGREIVDRIRGLMRGRKEKRKEKTQVEASAT